MSSFIPEYVYGHIPGTWHPMQYGLLPWPVHLRPREEPVEITKKGEAYVAAALAEADGVFFLTLAKGDRLSITTTIERLIDMLDALEEDPDLEPWLGDGDDREGEGGSATGADADCEPALGWGLGTQASLHASDEREDENEHGGDVLDEPHDDDGEAEPFLGWREQCSLQGVGLEGWDGAADRSDWSPDEDGHLHFDGAGYREAQAILRDLKKRRPDVPQAYVPVSPGLWS